MHQLSSSRQIGFDSLPTAVRGPGAETFRFDSCASHWRDVQPGDLYVALTTAEWDGHDHADEAVRRGAVAILAERLLPVSVPVFISEDTREAFGHLCHRLADRPSTQVHTIGVAGTSGKTTVARLIEAALSEGGRRVTAATDERWFEPDESQPASGPLTPPRIVAGLSDAAACGFGHVVIELQTAALARRLWAGTELDAVILTGMDDDYRGAHGSAVNCHRAIRRSLDLLKDAGLVIVNVDDPQLRALVEELDFPVLTYGIHHEATIQAEILEETCYDQLVVLHAGCDSIPIRLPRAGRHWLSNTLAAVTTALGLGIDLAASVRAIEMMTPAPCDLERVSPSTEFPSVMLDGATLPDRLRCTLSTLRRTTAGRVWCVLQVSEEVGAQFRPALGTLLERYCHGAAIAVAPALARKALAVTHDVLDGYERPGRDLVCPDPAKAIAWILSQAAPGDAVLIAGDVDGHREHIAQLLEERRAEFEVMATPPALLRFPTLYAPQEQLEPAPRILRIDDYRRSA